MEITFRKATEDDLPDLLSLYRYLHPADPDLAIDDTLKEQWRMMLANPLLYHLFACDGGRVAATCVLIVVPNLTRGGRPYAVIENVVTHPDFRRQGIGTKLLHHALQIAWDVRCYKAVLTTGRKDDAINAFYEQAGFDRNAKTAFVAKPPA